MSRTLMAAIQWRWPGACCVVRNGWLDRWDDRGVPAPSPSALADAVQAYAAVKDHAQLQQQATDYVTRRSTAALTWVLLRQRFPTDTVAQTKTKHAALQEDIIAAYQGQPWA